MQRRHSPSLLACRARRKLRPFRFREPQKCVREIYHCVRRWIKRVIPGQSGGLDTHSDTTVSLFDIGADSDRQCSCKPVTSSGACGQVAGVSNRLDHPQRVVVWWCDGARERWCEWIFVAERAIVPSHVTGSRLARAAGKLNPSNRRNKPTL